LRKTQMWQTELNVAVWRVKQQRVACWSVWMRTKSKKYPIMKKFQSLLHMSSSPLLHSSYVISSCPNFYSFKEKFQFSLFFQLFFVSLFPRTTTQNVPRSEKRVQWYKYGWNSNRKKSSVLKFCEIVRGKTLNFRWRKQ
jgi:hypothetical protein